MLRLRVPLTKQQLEQINMYNHLPALPGIGVPLKSRDSDNDRGNSTGGLETFIHTITDSPSFTV